MYLMKPIEREREKIKSILKELAEYYSRPITERQMELYIDDLMEMGAEITGKAALEYRRCWNNSSFPFPAQLRGAIKFTSRDLYAMIPRPLWELGLISDSQAGFPPGRDV